MSKGFEQLIDKFDKLNSRCQEDCRGCDYPDCIGYIWLLEEDFQKLYEEGIETVEVNEAVKFIHSFATPEGTVDMTKYRPKCIHRDPSNGFCNIHELRPMVCHMYPIGPDSLGGKRLWVLHNDCAFVSGMKERGELDKYIEDARNILSQIPSELYEEIVKVFSTVDDLSTFPDGENDFIVIKEM